MPNPWLELPDEPPFVLSADRPYVEAFNEAARRRPEHRIDTTLLPEPWLGCHDAPVLLLTANPGIDPGDAAVHRRHDFAQAVRANLTARGGRPNHLLDPRWTDAPGARWWRERPFKRLRTDGIDDSTLSKRVLAVEFHGYHSRNWMALPITLSSQWYSFALVAQALQRDAVVVISRPAAAWLVAVPELRRHPERVFVLRSTQNPSISPQNLGGDAGYEAVIAALGC